MINHHDLFMTVILQNQATGLSARSLRFALGVTEKEIQDLIYNGTYHQEISWQQDDKGVTRYRVTSQRVYKSPLRAVPESVFRLYTLLHENPKGLLFLDLLSLLNITEKEQETMINNHEDKDFIQYVGGPDRKVRTLLEVNPNQLVQCQKKSWWAAMRIVLWGR